MPQGIEHVENTLTLIGTASQTIGALGDMAWKTTAVAELAATAELLEAMKDRFFLKSRLCLPFAKRCEEAAQKLADLGAQSGSDAEAKLRAALGALSKATKTLDERSLMQGMAIT